MTKSRDSAVPIDLAALLARGYLRLLAADRNGQNPLDVAAEPKHELDVTRPLRRRPCKPA